MKDEIFRMDFGPYYIGCKKGKTRFTAWAKKSPIMGPDAVREPGEDVWFEMGDTQWDAIEKLQKSLP